MATKEFNKCSKNQQWLLCELVGALSKEDSAEFEKTVSDKEQTGISVEMTINGIDCDFFVVIDEMFRQFDRMIQEEALKKVEDKLSELNDIINEFQFSINEVKENIRKNVCQKLGLKYEIKYDLY